MRTSSKSIITASLILPLLLVACNRADQSPATGSSASQEKMAKNPSPSPADQMTEKSQPSPADASKNPAASSSSAPSGSGTAPVDQKNEPKKNY